MTMLRVVAILCLSLNVVFSTTAPVLDLNDGHKIPVVALGSGRGTAKESESVDEVRKAVFWAIEAGYRHIDTAAIYNDEEQVGQGISDAVAKGLVKRENLFVTTKLWSDSHARDQVLPSLRKSLDRLKLDYVDLYLIHFPASIKTDGSPDSIDYLDTWAGMEEAKVLGLSKSIGVSNFNSTQIDRLLANCNVKPAINQIEVNPTMAQVALVNHCQKKSINVMAYSPFGFLVSRNKGKETPPPRSDDPLLTKMAKKYGKSTGQIVLRYLIDRGVVIIPKSTNKDRIAQNIDLFNFKLTDEEVSTINRFNRDLRVIDFDSWKNYPNFPFVSKE